MQTVNLSLFIYILHKLVNALYLDQLIHSFHQYTFHFENFTIKNDYPD